MNICAVHGPMPRTWTNRASSSSSDSDSTSSRGTVPSRTFFARSATAAAFDLLSPALRMAPSGSASTPAGERPSAKSLRKRPWMAVAAAPASCWYTIDRTSAAKLSSLGGRKLIGPTRLMRAAMTGSRRATRRVPLRMSSTSRERAAGTWSSGEFGHEPGEVLARHAQLVLAQVLERPLRDVLGRREVVHRGVDIEQSGHEVALCARLLDHLNRGTPVPRVVVLAELLEQYVRPVVQLHVAHGARLVVDVDLFEERDERDIGDRLLVVLHPAVALGRSVVVVEGDAGRDDVEDRRAP